MSDPMNPYKKENLITTQITAREFNMLKEIRSSSSFGKITVHKADGVVVRVETQESVLIDDKWEEVL